ncbi:MAG: methyltransferase [Sphingobacteriales bacterium]|nr:methyltransferase [Sphingobacteriales bacterium]
MIKRLLEKIAKWIAGSTFLWKLSTPLIYLSNHIQANKKNNTPQEVVLNPFLIQHLGKPVVKNGPFQGMAYPSFQSVGSTIFPKIIGSYEAELHTTVETLIGRRFEHVYDVGCAEGYYAIGFALRNPETKIFAYDINDTARTLCRQMSVLNHVEERVCIETAFTQETFKQIPQSKDTLIICDCEGYELDLFTESCLPYLVHATLLIETHDFLNPEISIQLQQLLGKSHTIQLIQSTDDILKAKYYSYRELEGLDIRQRREAVKEMRPAIMEWIVAVPK